MSTRERRRETTNVIQDGKLVRKNVWATGGATQSSSLGLDGLQADIGDTEPDVLVALSDAKYNRSAANDVMEVDGKIYATTDVYLSELKPGDRIIADKSIGYPDDENPRLVVWNVEKDTFDPTDLVVTTRGLGHGYALGNQYLKQHKITSSGKSIPEVNRVASVLHEQWQDEFFTENGANAVRPKDDGEGGTVDIANTPFLDLPTKWQAENKAAALSAIHRVVEETNKVTVLTGESGPHANLGNRAIVDDVASEIHNDWLDRNGSWAPPEQNIDYYFLSEVEKEKDRVVARAAAKILNIDLDD